MICKLALTKLSLIDSCLMLMISDILFLNILNAILCMIFLYGNQFKKKKK